MSIKHFLFMIVFFSLITFSAVQAQGPTDSTSARNSEIIDLAAEIYKIPVEAPQVKLLTDRIKPEFDSVHLDKSFRKEITGAGERFILEPIKQSGEIEKVDVSKILNRKR